MTSKFVAAHQQAGDFQVVVRNGKVEQKNGGNVASYFCTPEGRVINAVLGPVEAEELLREAKWAVDVYATVQDATPRERDARLTAAHLDAARQRGGQAQQIHRLLADRPLAGLDQIYRRVFQLLGEGERAKGLESQEVLALEDENERIRDEANRIRERLDGAGSAKALALKDENSRLRNEKERLQKIDEQRRREEAQALNWLRAATAYLQTGAEEGSEAARLRLKLILEKYPNTKAAETAARMLADGLRSPGAAVARAP